MILAQIVPKLNNCVKRRFLGKADQCKLCQYIVSHHAKIFQNKLCGILHTCTKKPQSYDVQFLKYRVRQICFVILGNLWSFTTIVRRGVQSPPEKTQSHLKTQFPPEMTLLKSHQNFQTRLKSNFLFTPIWNMYLKRFSR